MKIGLYLGGGGPSPQVLIDQVRSAARRGLDSAFISQLTSWDALTVGALAAAAVPGIELGTAVVQTYPRHPLALAGQALTVQAVATSGFTLGIGPSHPQFIEGQFGYRYDRPARHIREYLSALLPLLRGEAVDVHGETVTAVGRLDVPAATPPSVLLSALGPVMLQIAGELTDGAVTVWTGPQTVGDHIVPAITRAAAAAGRPAPRVVSGVIVCVTADPDRARAEVAAQVGFASDLPAYRAILDRQGLAGVHETVVAGTAEVVERALRRYADAGATELIVSLIGDPQEQVRTLDVVAALRSAG